LVAPPDVEQPQVQDTTQKFHGDIAAARSHLSDAESRDLEELLTEYGEFLAMDSDTFYRIQRNSRSRMMEVHLDWLVHYEGTARDDRP
jgi:CBS-domain-containing membrane protein